MCCQSEAERESMALSAQIFLMLDEIVEYIIADDDDGEAMMDEG